jgi:hypothetical protein
MIDRRFILALPLFVAAPALAQPTDTLATALAQCWLARGVRFTPEQISARIAGRTGKAALLAVAGAWTDADGDDQETMVEIVWEAGQPPSPAEPLLIIDLVAKRPALLLTNEGHWWLLDARYQAWLLVRHPISGVSRMLSLEQTLLIGRPMIAGA